MAIDLRNLQDEELDYFIKKAIAQVEHEKAFGAPTPVIPEQPALSTEQVSSIATKVAQDMGSQFRAGIGAAGEPAFTNVPTSRIIKEQLYPKPVSAPVRAAVQPIKPTDEQISKAVQMVMAPSTPTPARVSVPAPAIVPERIGLTAEETGEQMPGVRLPEPAKEPLLAFEPFGGSIGLTPEAIKVAGLMPGYVAPGQEHPGFISPERPVPEKPIEPTKPSRPWGEEAYNKIMTNPLVMDWLEFEKTRSRGKGPEGEPAIFTPEETVHLLGWFGPEVLNLGKGIYGEEGFIESFKKAEQLSQMGETQLAREHYLKATGGVIDDLFRATLVLPITGMLRIGGEAAVKALRGAAQKAKLKKADEFVKAAAEAARERATPINIQELAKFREREELLGRAELITEPGLPKELSVAEEAKRLALGEVPPSELRTTPQPYRKTIVAPPSEYRPIYRKREMPIEPQPIRERLEPSVPQEPPRVSPVRFAEEPKLTPEVKVAPKPIEEAKPPIPEELFAIKNTKTGDVYFAESNKEMHADIIRRIEDKHIPFDYDYIETGFALPGKPQTFRSGTFETDRISLQDFRRAEDKFKVEDRLAREIDKAQGAVAMAEATKSPRLEEITAKRDALLDQRDKILWAEMNKPEAKTEWAIETKSGKIISDKGDRSILDHADLAEKSNIDFDQVKSTGYIVGGKYHKTSMGEIPPTETAPGLMEDRKWAFKVLSEPKKYSPEELTRAETIYAQLAKEQGEAIAKTKPWGFGRAGEAEVIPAEAKATPAIPPNIPMGYLQSIKQPDGKWKLFYRGTRNEVFPGEVFNSNSEAKQFFKAQQIKEKPTPQPAAQLRESIEIPLLRQIAEKEVTATKGDTLNALVGKETYTWKVGENWVSRPGIHGTRDEWFSINREKMKTVGVEGTPKWAGKAKVGITGDLPPAGEPPKPAFRLKDPETGEFKIFTSEAGQRKPHALMYEDLSRMGKEMGAESGFVDSTGKFTTEIPKPPRETTLGGGITPVLQTWYEKLAAARQKAVLKAEEAKKPIIEGRPKYVGESINISKMTTTPEAKDLLIKVSEQMGRKEVIPDKVIWAEVQKIHESVPDQQRVLKVIENQDYHKLKTSDRLWYKANLQRIAEKEHGNMSEAIRTGKIKSNAELNEAMDKLLMEQSMLGVMEKHRKVVAEPGRQLRALGLMPKSSSLSDIRQFLKRETTEGEFKIIQDFVFKHPKDHEGLYELLKQFKDKPPTVLQHILTYQYMNMLSGPKTWGINIFTNLYNLLGVKPAVRVGAGVLSAIRHPVDKAKRAYFVSEIFPMYAEIGRKAPAAAKLFGKILIGKKEIPPGSKFIKDIGEAAVSWRRSDNKVLRAMAPAPEFVYRVMAGADVGVRLMAAEGEMAALAHRAALQKGLKWGSPDYTKFVEHAKAHDMGMWKKAQQFADETVFFEELGTLSKKVEKLRSEVPATKFFIEFFRTIANLKRQEVEFVPVLGLAFGARRAAKLAQGYELATKQLVGGAIGYWMWQKAERGELVGTLKGKELQVAKDLGRGSYYIKFGNTWINYSRIWPFNTLLASVADLNKNYRRHEMGEIEGSEATWNMVHGTINNFMEQTYISPMAQYLSENLRPGVPAKAIGKFLPLSSMMRQFSQVVDMAQNGGLLEGKLPTRELSKDILEKVLDGFESTYFHRHKVPQRITWAGEKAVSEGGVYQPYWWSKRQETPAEKEFARLGYGPPRTDDFFVYEGVRYKLKTEHHQELQKRVGKYVKRDLERVVQRGRYQNIKATKDKTADENKRAILDQVTNEIKNEIREDYIKSIARDYIKERRGERQKRGITPQYVGAGR